MIIEVKKEKTTEIHPSIVMSGEGEYETYKYDIKFNGKEYHFETTIRGEKPIKKSYQI